MSLSREIEPSDRRSVSATAAPRTRNRTTVVFAPAPEDPALLAPATLAALFSDPARAVARRSRSTRSAKPRASASAQYGSAESGAPTAQGAQPLRVL